MYVMYVIIRCGMQGGRRKDKYARIQTVNSFPSQPTSTKRAPIPAKLGQPSMSYRRYEATSTCSSGNMGGCYGEGCRGRGGSLQWACKLAVGVLQWVCELAGGVEKACSGHVRLQWACLCRRRPEEVGHRKKVEKPLAV
jgi:hypothetical protein